MSSAIKVDNLGKRYRLGQTHAGSIRELVNRAWKRLLGRKEHLLPHEHAETQALAERQLEDDGTFWALRDVSFEVQPGEVVGIIGRNGSGKSTLLKILSQITAPTAGRVELHGRVASLLEVGTGFHPELSGRENVFLNGAILGMTRPEIRRKFDEIVTFAEIDKFIDTPVKRYSSGMYVRLAFAVAAHLEPEILVVDEVLAVGDAAFQQKCLGKMGNVAQDGRTILFVSHNMAAVTSLCPRSIQLSDGEIRVDGPSEKVTQTYLTSLTKAANTGEQDLRVAARHGGDGKVRFTRVRLSNADGQVTTVFAFGDAIHIELELVSEVSLPYAEFGYSVKNSYETILFTSSTTDHQAETAIEPGVFRIAAVISPNYLRPGVYSMQLGTTCGVLRDLIPNAIHFEISDAKHYSQTSIYSLPGIFHFGYRWSSLEKITSAEIGLCDSGSPELGRAV